MMRMVLTGKSPSAAEGFALQGAASRQATAALERFIEIVGEAVKRLPVELRDRYPVVPWKEIAGTRDRLSHGYDDVDYQVLWDAVENDIPVLLATVDQMLNDL